MKHKVVSLALICFWSTWLYTQNITDCNTIVDTLIYSERVGTEKIELCEEAYSALEKDAANNQFCFSEFLHRYGSLLYEKGEYQAAKKQLRKALSARKAILPPNHFDYLRTTYIYGIILYKTNDLDSAEIFLRETIDVGQGLSEADNKNNLLWNAHTELSTVLSDHDEYDKSLDHLEKAISHFNKLVTPSYPCENKIRHLYLKSIVYTKQKKFKDAIEALNNAAEEAEKECLIVYSDVANNLGLTYHIAGDYQSAEEEYLNALIRFKPSEETLYNIYSNQVINYVKLGEYIKAEEAYQKGLKLARKNKDTFVITELHEHKAQLEEAKGKLQEATNFYIESISILTPNEKRKHNIPIIEGRPIIGKNRLIKILALYAKNLAVQNKLRLAAYETYKTLDTLITDVRIGHQTEEAKFFRIAEAVPIYEAAIANALELQAQQPSITNYLKQAYDFARRNKAALHYDDMRLRDVLKQFDKKMANREKVLKGLIHEEERKLNEGKLTAKQSNLRNLWDEHRKLLDTIKINAPAYYDLKYAFSDLPTTDAIQEKMPNDMAIVEYFFGEKAIYIFVLTKALGLQVYTKNDIKDVKYKVETFLNQEMASVCLSNSLYKPLLKSALENVPKNIKRLRIVPDDVLCKLPFQVLNMKDDETSHFLIQNYAISYAISGKEHHFKRKYDASVHDYIGYGTNYETGILSYLTFLPKAIQELEESAKYYDIAVYKKAIQNDFYSNFGKSKILHLPLHGFVDTTNVLDSKIMFGDNPLMLYELYAKKHKVVNLVILSACDLGNGKFNKGEGLRNFIRAFQYIGAESVVSSLGVVYDEYASELMINFNKSIAEGYPLDEALQAATLEYLEDDNPVHAATRFWANFVLVGNPEAIF